MSMIIRIIHVGADFREQFCRLPKAVQKRALKTEALFRKNPFHPSLRLHKLQGRLKNLWSLSLDRKYRIVFKIMKDGMILFVSIGLHAIYEK